MGRVDGVIETLARRDRAVVLAALGLLVALAWIYTLVMALHGSEIEQHVPSALAAWKPWTAADAAFMVVMWIVMMVAMMMPASAPMLLAFARISRGRDRLTSPISLSGAFISSYLALWLAFSVLATVVQWLLHATALLSPAMASASPAFSAALLITAGAYQFTPIKNACLSRCRTPMGFLLTEWREGSRGAFVMGLRHGLYCVGCCWLLMTLLFVAGVMNLLWIAFLAVSVLAEKVLPFGKWASRALGIALILWGTSLLAFA